MDKNLYDFLIIWSVGILFIFCIGIWLNKMIKIIIWSYILIATSLAIFSLLEFFTTSLMWFRLPFIDYDISPILNFINSYKQYINILLYFVLFALIFVKFSIVKLEAKNLWLKILFYVLLTPLTVMSIVSSLLVAVFGAQVIDNEKLIKFVQQFEESTDPSQASTVSAQDPQNSDLTTASNQVQTSKKRSVMYYFFRLTPIWIILPWFFILLISVFLWWVKVWWER